MNDHEKKISIGREAGSTRSPCKPAGALSIINIVAGARGGGKRDETRDSNDGAYKAWDLVVLEGLCMVQIYPTKTK